MPSSTIGPQHLAGSLADPINTEERELNLWEKRIGALYRLLSNDKRS